MKQIELTPRLRTVADLVPQGARLADVGTDHAYLPAWLLQHDRIGCAIATDLRSGPLDRARETASACGLEGRMDFRLCDGLKGIAPEEVDTITIAGRGGETIAAILEGAPWTRTGQRTLLLQPMSTQRELRQWLQENGYQISQELLACEGEVFYNILEVVPGQMLPLTRAELWAGKQNLNDRLRGAYLSHELKRISRIVAGLKCSQTRVSRERLERLELLRGELLEMKKEWERQWQQ